MKVTINIAAVATVTARLDVTVEQVVHQQAGDWQIRLIDPASTNQAIMYEYQGPEKSAEFDLNEGDVYNLRAARLDVNGNVIGAVMVMGYRVGGGSLAAIDVPTAISTTEG